MLRVRVSEMQRQIAKQFGIDVSTAAIAAGVPIALSTNNQFGLLGQALNDLSGGQVGQVCTSGANPLAGGTCTIHPNNVESSFKALEQVGLLHTLAEPNLTAVSGETAKFLAGGEFPVPAGRDQQGNVSIEFKQFGVGLSFTPVVLSDGRISLQVSTEVSELTNTGAFTLRAVLTSTQRRDRHHVGPDHSGAGGAPRRNHRRTAIGRLFRNRRHDAAYHQAGDRRVPGRQGYAGAGRVVPQPRLRE